MRVSTTLCRPNDRIAYSPSYDLSSRPLRSVTRSGRVSTKGKGKAVALNQSNLPQTRSSLLCITSIPAHMVPTDMLQFMAPFRRNISYMRILRPCGTSSNSAEADGTAVDYMVALQFTNQVSNCRHKHMNAWGNCAVFVWAGNCLCKWSLWSSSRTCATFFRQQHTLLAIKSKCFPCWC